jgi:hypothetical protein
MDLHGFFKVLGSKLKESGQSIVLLHVRSAVFVKVVVLAVTAVEQGLEGRNDVAVHGGDPVSPEEEGMKGLPGLAAILRGGVLLHMLPRCGGGVLGMEDSLNLLRISEEGYGEWAIGLENVLIVLLVGVTVQDRCTRDQLRVDGGISPYQIF